MSQIHALLRERHALVEDMRSSVERAEARGGMTPDAKREIERVDSEIQKLDDRIGELRRSHTAEGHPLATTAGRSDEVALTGEQRFADWYEARHGGPGLATGGLATDSLTGGDVREFNLGNIAAALLGRVDRRDLSDAEQRALAEGVDASGGFLIPEVLSTRVIDRVRNASRVIDAGALTVGMESDTLNLARLAGGNTANWKIENDVVAQSDQTWERVQLKTKTATVLQRVSQELFEDLSPEGAKAIEFEILSALALKLDLAALRGSGVDPEPRGIRNQAGVNLIAFGGANGGTPANHDFLIDALASIRDDNGTPNAAIYASRTATTIDKFKDTTGQPLRQPDSVAELSKFVSNQVPVNLTTGTSTDTSEVYVADWSTVLIGLRPTVGMRVKVLSERYADNLQIGLMAWIRADVALAHPEHCAVVTGIRP